MLGFSVQPEDRKPGWRDLKVKVSVEHASVSARNGFYYGTPPVELAKRADEVTALASALPQSAVPMFVKVLGSPPSSAASNSASAAAEKKTIAFRHDHPAQWPAHRRLEPRLSGPGSWRHSADARQERTEGSSRIHSTAEGQSQPGKSPGVGPGRNQAARPPSLSPPGSYDLRFFARDNNSARIGTVVFPLDVK